MNIKQIWEKMNEAWYKLLDSLADKGIPVYKLVDPLEARGIPSLPLVIGVVIIVIFGILFSISAPGGAGPVSAGSLTLVIKSGGKALEGASIYASINGKSLTAETDENGKAVLNLPGPGVLEITINKTGCEEFSQQIKYSGGTLFKTISLNCTGTIQPEAGCIEEMNSLEAIPISDPSGNVPSNCKVYAVHPDGTRDELPWEVTEDGYLVAGGGCVHDDDYIEISCDGFTGDYTPDDLLTLAETGQTLILTPGSASFSGSGGNWPGTNGNPSFGSTWNGTGWDSYWNTSDSDNIDDNENGIPDTNEYDSQQDLEAYTKLTVTVKDKETRQLLSGIQITAVDQNGTKLPGNTTGITENGVATIMVPRHTISVQAVDPNGVYATFTTPPFYPMGYLAVNLVKGWKTVVWVKKPDGRGISGATVVIDKVKKTTDFQGKAIFTLPKSEYEVFVFKDGYKPEAGSVVGGGSTNITLIPLTDNNSAPLAIEIMNPTRMDDPFPNVNLRLISSDGLLGGECKTGTNGQCSWSRIFATTYTVYAKPPMAYEYEQIGSIEVKTNQTNTYSLEVEPVHLNIRIRTLVNGKPQDGVKVTLYTTYPDLEKIEERKSENSYVNFDAPWGNEYYLTASWKNKTNRLYGTLGPFKLLSEKNLEINLEPPKTDLSLEIKETVKRGSREYGTLTVGLPYVDPKRRIPYEKITVYIWAGEPGDKEDPEESPILVDKVPELVHMAETTQVPKLGISGYSSYSESPTGRLNPATQSSKVLEITITNYKPGTTSFKIPFLVREGGLASNTTIHYRAVYTSKESTYDTGWKEKSVKITGKTDWIPIPTGDFYLQKSGLTLVPDSKDWQKEITATKDSLVFLHIRAISRGESKHGVIDLGIQPEIASPQYFWGYITNGSKKWEISETEVSGNKIDVMKGSTKETLEPEDEVDVTIALHMDTNGTVNITPFAEEYQSSGTPQTLIIHIKNVTLDPTPIPGVSGSAIGQVHLTQDNLPTGISGDCWGTYVDEPLPVFSENKSIGRDFKILVTMVNSEKSRFKANIDVETDLDVDYPTSVTIGPGTTQFTITGSGPEEPSEGEIKIWIWQEGTDKPDKPWKTLEYGPNDFFISLETNNSFEEPKILSDAVTLLTTDGYIQTVDSHHNVFKLSTATYNGVQASKTFVGDEPAYHFVSPGQSAGSEITVHTKADEFDISKKYLVQGTIIRPDPGYLGHALFKERKSKFEKDFQIINYWKSEVTIETVLYNMENGKLDKVLSHLGTKSLHYYDISMNATILGQLNQNVDSGQLKLEPGQQAILHLIIAPEGSKANDYKLKLMLVLEPKVSGTEIRNQTYFMNVSSDLPSPTTGPISGNFVAGKYFVIREDASPSRVDYKTSCLAVQDQYGNLKSAKICDAKQMGMLIKSMISDLRTSKEKYIIGGPYAFGNDVLTVNDLDKITGYSIKKLDINGQDKITCGIVKFLITQNPDGTYNITGELNPGMPWCQAGWPSFFLGLLNPDKGLNTPTRIPYAFELGKDEFSGHASEALSGNLKVLTSYKSSFVSNPPTQGDWYTVKWYEVSTDEITQTENPELLWVKDEMSGNKVVGFVKWYPSNYQGIGRLANSYLMGVVYDPSMKESSSLESIKKCFVASLLYHWLTGNSTVINETKVQEGIVVPLENCKNPYSGVLINVPSYDFEIYDETESRITGKWTNKNTVFIKAVNNNQNVPIDYCLVGLGSLSGAGQVNWTQVSNEYYEISDLEEGKNQIYLECMSKDGVMGPAVVKNVSVDTKPPSISGPSFVGLALGLNQCVKHVNFTITEDGSGLAGCSVYPVLPNTDEILWSYKSGDCNEAGETLAGTIMQCEIGDYDWNNNIYTWIGGGSGCITLPQHLKAAVVCKDKVGNIGILNVSVLLSGSAIDVEPAELVECPVLTTAGDIEEKKECLFKDSAKDLSTGYIYTNLEAGEEVTLAFKVTSTAPETSCVLQVTGKDYSETYPGTNEGDTWIFTLTIPENEGKYNVSVVCSSPVETEEGKAYRYVGEGCNLEGAFTGCGQTTGGGYVGGGPGTPTYQ